MKKLFKSTLVLLAALMLMTACGSKSSTYKMGVASVQGVAVDAQDENKAVFDTVVAAVVLDGDKIVYAYFDQSEQIAELNEEFTSLPTKKVRGDSYGMVVLSQIGKEWYEQLEALEKDLVGKTVDEANAYLGSDDVLSSATLYLGDFTAAFNKAVANAVEVKDVAKVGLGVNAALNNFYGDAESSLEYAFVAVDKDGKIVKALLDTAQELAKPGDAWELVNVGKTKGELKEAYGMVVASPIGKEWFEQTNALMDHLEGLSFDQALALSVEDEDLKTSVSMTIDGVLVAIKDAQANLVSF